jgi:hypothetical protein
MYTPLLPPASPCRRRRHRTTPVPDHPDEHFLKTLKTFYTQKIEPDREGRVRVTIIKQTAMQACMRMPMRYIDCQLTEVNTVQKLSEHTMSKHITHLRRLLEFARTTSPGTALTSLLEEKDLIPRFLVHLEQQHGIDNPGTQAGCVRTRAVCRRTCCCINFVACSLSCIFFCVFLFFYFCFFTAGM